MVVLDAIKAIGRRRALPMSRAELPQDLSRAQNRLGAYAGMTQLRAIGFGSLVIRRLQKIKESIRLDHGMTPDIRRTQIGPASEQCLPQSALQKVNQVVSIRCKLVLRRQKALS